MKKNTRRKIQASGELWHAIKGSIDTPEKFDAKRPQLAEHEWRRMKANGSQECRNCHDASAFDYSARGYRAVSRHMEATVRQSRIDCHKGIAHKLPPVKQGISAAIPGSFTANIFRLAAIKEPRTPEK
jgi:cytochrome c-type protein NapC